MLKFCNRKYTLSKKSSEYLRRPKWNLWHSIASQPKLGNIEWLDWLKANEFNGISLSNVIVSFFHILQAKHSQKCEKAGDYVWQIIVVKFISLYYIKQFYVPFHSYWNKNGLAYLELRGQTLAIFNSFFSMPQFENLWIMINSVFHQQQGLNHYSNLWKQFC